MPFPPRSRVAIEKLGLKLLGAEELKARRLRAKARSQARTNKQVREEAQ